MEDSPRSQHRAYIERVESRLKTNPKRGMVRRAPAAKPSSPQSQRDHMLALLFGDSVPQVKEAASAFQSSEKAQKAVALGMLGLGVVLIQRATD